MTWLDGLVLLPYLFSSLALGYRYLAPRDAPGPETFFLAGRTLPGWLGGISMAAAGLAVEAPLYVTGLVATHGLGAGLVWWGLAVPQGIGLLLVARLWRRAGVTTELELTERRYGGPLAAWLRGTKGLLWGLGLNGLLVGYSLRGLFQLLRELQLGPGMLEAVVAYGLIGALLGGLGLRAAVGLGGVHWVWGLLAGGGVAFAASRAVDVPLAPLVLSPSPPVGHGFASVWGSGLGVYLLLSYGGCDRSLWIQRLLASRSEVAAQRSVGWLVLLHYGLQPWIWLVPAVVVLGLDPDLVAPGLGGAYPTLLGGLPPGTQGLGIIALVAAFMATLVARLNWGASLLTVDVYRRFLRPQASALEQQQVGQLSGVLVMLVGGLAAWLAPDLHRCLPLAIALTVGPGLVFCLRWFWWRVNAAAELAAIVTAMVVGLGTMALAPSGPLPLLLAAGLPTVAAMAALGLTPAESPECLDRFYWQVRPASLGWRLQRYRTQRAPAQSLVHDLQRGMAMVLLLAGMTLALGGVWLQFWWAVGGGAIAMGAGLLWLRGVGDYVPPVPRPGLDDTDGL